MNMILEITLRLFVALILGGIIGIEREYRSKEAGFRTHFLVALGSALFCIVSQYGFGFDLKDSSRVAAQVVSGIGGNHYFSKECSAWSDYCCWIMGDGSYRIDLWNWHVYSSRHSYSYGAFRTGSHEFLYSDFWNYYSTTYLYSN